MNYYEAKFARERKPDLINWVITPVRGQYQLLKVSDD